MRPIALDLAWLAGVVTLLVAFGSAVYLAVTFLVMRRFTDPRPWRRSLRALLGEAIAIAVTQPLLPLFYFVGRHLGGAKDGRPVIFIHGYFQNRVDFLYLAWAASRARLGPLYGFNYDWRHAIATSAKSLERFVEQVVAETGKDKVALVAHSLGGVVALEYLGTPAGKAHVDRCITLASPHAGVRWRGSAFGAVARELHVKSEYMLGNAARALAIPVVSIYSSHDNIVHPKATSALTSRGGVDTEVDGVGHLGILFSREVAATLVRTLSE